MLGALQSRGLWPAVPSLLICWCFFPLLCPRCALQWSRCSGRSCGSAGRCLWPSLDFIPARCEQSPERGRKLLLEEGLGVQCLSCSLPPSLCLEQGARGTSSTFSCPTCPSVTGMQLPRCPWSWAGPGCSRMAIHGLWSLLYAVYIHFFKTFFLYAACFGITRGQACTGWEFWTFLVSQSVRTDAGCLFHSCFLGWRVLSSRSC